MKHKDRNLTLCQDFRGIGAGPEEKTGRIEDPDDMIPKPRKAENEEEK